MRQRYRFIYCLIILVFIGLIPSFSVTAEDNPIDSLFRPLRNLNITEFYASNSWLDFLIFLCLFIPVAKMTIGKRFGGREGNILSGVIGVILALSLSLAEMKIGFSIRSFGPLAAGIFVFIVGLVIFYLIKTLGAGNTAAGSLAFVLSYFLMRATVPNFFLWLEENSWTAWLHLILVLAVIISIINLFLAIWPKSEFGALGGRLEHSNSPNLNLRKAEGEGNSQLFLIKSRLENLTKKGMKESKEIIENLKELIRIIDEHGNTPQGRHLISEKIKQIVPKENIILKQLAYIKDISQRIENVDLESLKDLREHWGKIPEKDRGIFREELVVEKKKILSDEKLRDLESKLLKYDKNFRYSLNMSVMALRGNQPGQAKDWLQKAIRSEEEALIMFKEMKTLEDQLLKLTRVEYKVHEREAKEVA